jgi:hypothetical protein
MGQRVPDLAATIDERSQYLRMNGLDVFQVRGANLSCSLNRTVDEAGLTPMNHLYIPQQPTSDHRNGPARNCACRLDSVIYKSIDTEHLRRVVRWRCRVIEGVAERW